MSTFVDFVRSANDPFQFQPTLNGVQYTVVVTWNIFREGYYLNLLDLSNNLLLCEALAESGPQFRGTLTWSDNVGVAVLSAPHNVPIGTAVVFRILNTNDSGFDGVYEGVATQESTLTFDLPTNPDQPVAILGTISFDVDLLKNYDFGSLYFHAETQQFEY